MTEMVDDELLGGEELDDVYDITNEREEALLQEDEDYSKSRDDYDRKKRTEYSDAEDEDDVLNLDIEEDFQDEDKLLYDEEEEEEEKNVKVSSENVQNTNQSSKTIASTPVKTTHTVSRTSSEKKNNIEPQKVFKNDNKNVVRNNNGKWKRGNGRGHFQNRQNFLKNKLQRRRNGRTVLINPNYEGTVHISENNARLAWDNQQYSQNNTTLVQPWASGNTFGSCNVNAPNQFLMSNLMTGLANSLAQHAPTNALLPPPVQPQVQQNFYEPPSTNYEQPLLFEPPPSIMESQRMQPTYNNQNQHAIGMGWDNSYMTTDQMSKPPPLLQQPYMRKPPQREYNNRTNEIQDTKPFSSYSNYNSYGHTNTQNTLTQSTTSTNSYENRNLNYNRYNSRPPTYNTYPQQTDFQNKNDSYTSRNPNYSNYPTETENNKFKTNFDERRLNKFNRMPNENLNYNQDFKYNQTNNQFNNKFQNNVQQVQMRRDFNRPNNFTVNTVNQSPQKTFPQKNRWPTSSEPEVPEKKANTFEKDKMKKENDGKMVSAQERTQSNVTKTPAEEQEDEEIKSYRLKIEEQKRERERLLKIKEERRRQKMMLQRQKQDEVLGSTTEFKVENQQQQPKPVLQTVKLNNFEQSVVQKPNITVKSEFVQKFTPQSSGPPQRQNFRQNQKSSLSSSLLSYPQQLTADQSSDGDLSNFTFKVSNNLQSKTQIQKEPAKSEASSSNFMSNRVVVVKNKNPLKSGIPTNSNVTVANTVTNVVSNESSENSGQGLSSFFNNRKVLKKDNSLLNTRLVVVNNLSTTINQNKLMALSRGIGEIQKLRVDTQERQATILFKSVASAHAFFKKYQRRILDDLSVIEVKLEPMI